MVMGQGYRPVAPLQRKLEANPCPLQASPAPLSLAHSVHFTIARSTSPPLWMAEISSMGSVDLFWNDPITK